MANAHTSGQASSISLRFIVTDEPTNYLDLNAALWLKEYLASFDGTFIMISHDKAFLNDVTNFTFVLSMALITKIQGNYEQYERIKEERRVFLGRQFKEQRRSVNSWRGLLAFTPSRIKLLRCAPNAAYWNE